MQLDGGRRRGFFLTLEGPEGSGKSTQAHRLGGRLTAAGYHCIVTREPGGTPLGEEVRKIILHELSPVPAADALLFNAARAQLVTEVIEPALARGDVVICDRFADSTLAYQGYGAGQPIEALRVLAGYAAGDLVPDLTILLDLPAEEGIRRKREGDEINRFESTLDLTFHRRVRDGFLALAAAEPDRFVVLDGRLSPEQTEIAVADALRPRLANKQELRRGNAERRTPNFPAVSSEPNGTSVRMNK
ncbi:MAG TPA: dTMP kinase [Terriglobales bacterium]|nr:dTMP kinase [Terriglobales bacterium]